MCEAAACNDVEGVKKALAKGVDLSQSCVAGDVCAMEMTPLMWAAGHFAWSDQEGTEQNKQLEIMRLLIERKANPNQYCSLGWGPLHHAKHGKATKILLDAKADANAVREWDGCTPLMVAIQDGYPDIVQTLLEHTPAIRLDIKDKSGKTALEFDCSDDISAHAERKKTGEQKVSFVCLFFSPGMAYPLLIRRGYRASKPRSHLVLIATSSPRNSSACACRFWMALRLWMCILSRMA